jgi:cell division protein FtsW (lipid II flippase)
LIGITLVSVLAVTPQVSATNPDDRIEQLVGRVQPRVLNGTVWLLTGIAATVLWYRLPVDRFHKAILIGLVPFLLIFTIGLNAIERNNWSRGTVESVNLVHALAYLFLLAFWARAAWAPLRAAVQPQAPLQALERQAG